MRVYSLGQEEFLEEDMATHSSILAWRIPWTEKPGGLQSMGVARVRHNLVTKPPPPPKSVPKLLVLRECKKKWEEGPNKSMLIFFPLVKKET